ncbi:sigma-70 region 4 domain-containing protein [Eubacterium sp. AB3007]|uniref:sigma-70 region 4 domain-containing protein n=1 Tax=Eubacterium sp. AB3007 TaxID=1392487 RepID=UPI000489DA5C|nr:sigma-70 region 4 domain-containing protein [Eubacterium sp. AB3007]
MKIQLRYDTTFQTIVLDAEEARGLWLSIGPETDEEMTEEEFEKRVQAAVDEEFNKPEYNNWHKFNRHRGYSKDTPGRDDTDEEMDFSEPLMDEVRDRCIFLKDEIDRERNMAYEADCQWIRETLAKKPDWADMFIAIRLDDESIKSYAARTGMSENSVSQKLKRAARKLKENWDKRQI